MVEQNTFAAACYDQNSVEELEQALLREPDERDMDEWGLIQEEWRQQIELAIREKKEAGENFWDEPMHGGM